MDDLEKRFKEASSEIVRLIEKRRSSWKLYSVMEFDDVSSRILSIIWKNWGKYDPVQPLDRWVNTVITNAMRSILRDKLYRFARPCISATSYGTCCSFNTGGDGCSWTLTDPKGSGSGIQDASCKFYAKWLKKKQAKFAVAAPLSIENHVDESHSIHSDYVDYEEAQSVIHERIMDHLDPEEAKIYRLLYIKGLEPKEVGQRLGFKKQKNSKIRGYLIIRTAQIRFVKLAKEIIEKENLCK